MQKLILPLLMIIVLACNNNADSGTSENDTILEAPDSIIPAAMLPWTTEFDTVSGRFSLKKQHPADSTATAQALIHYLNGSWENIVMVFKSISHDTLYVAIPQSEYLTQRMGSSGATEYMATATYNLTELPGIRYVNYSFEPGEHLSPGTLSRNDFSDFH